MSAALHTPGPWSQHLVRVQRDIVGPNGSVAYTRGYQNAEEDCANARLIAAAPSMATALQRAARILAELPDNMQTTQMLALRAEIVEAIKLATPEYYGGQA